MSDETESTPPLSPRWIAGDSDHGQEGCGLLVPHVVTLWDDAAECLVVAVTVGNDIALSGAKSATLTHEHNLPGRLTRLIGRSDIIAK